MKELHVICKAYRKINFSKQKAALATVMRVRGSSYRSPGARMLITDDGRWVGSISGGCLEGDALRKARQVMREKTTLTVTYDTSEEDNNTFSINLGCNGIIDVLIEPLDPADERNPMLIFESLLGLETATALATCFSDHSQLNGKKMLLKSGALSFQEFDHPDLSERITADLLELFTSKRSRATVYEVAGEQVEVFLELLQPPIKLMIFGGGYDARPLCLMAKNLGWSVTVTDECVAHIAPVFFPGADGLSLCHREFVDRELSISANTACVLMSHNYDYDRDVLKKLLRTDTPYIGILGPRKRFDKMLKDFADQDLTLTERDWDRIHAPIGIDIGAETPDEIAISIIGEVMAKFSKRDAGFLKYRTGPIHRRDTASDQVFKEATL